MAASIIFGVLRVIIGIVFVAFSIFAIIDDLGNLSILSLVLSTVMFLVNMVFYGFFKTEPYHVFCISGIFYIVLFANFIFPYFSALLCGCIVLEGLSLITSVIPFLHNLIFTHKLVYFPLFLIVSVVYFIRHLDDLTS